MTNTERRYADNAEVELALLGSEIESDESEGGTPAQYAEYARLEPIALGWTLDDEHNFLHVVRVISQERDDQGNRVSEVAMVDVPVDADAFIESTYTCACGLIVDWPHATEIPWAIWDSLPGHVTFADSFKPSA